MNSNTLLGLVVGALAGAVIVQTCKPAKDLVEKATKEVKSRLAPSKTKTVE